MLNHWTRILAVVMLVAMGVLFGASLSDPAWAQRAANVKDVENPDKQAALVFGPHMLTIPDGNNLINYCLPNTVPTGKRWIIEHVTARVFMLANGQFPALQIYVTTPSVHSFIPLTYQGGQFLIGFSEGYLWAADQLTKLRVDAGGTFCAAFLRGNGMTGEAFLHIGFSGYEIDYP
jgi:hypothetical protein